MVFWDFLVWFFWIYIIISAICLLVAVLVDIFRDKTLGGGAKALWVLFIIVVPFLAALIYLAARGTNHGDGVAA